MFRLRRKFAVLVALLVALSIVDPVHAVGQRPNIWFDVLDEAAIPKMTWKVPGRFNASWEAFNPSSGLYDPTFVNPDKWTVHLDACSSTSKRRILSYTFALTGPDGWSSTSATPACKLILHTLPSLGTYVVNIVLHTDFGGGTQGVSPILKQIIEIRDRLIVVMGDSLAAGEGNPDELGSYNTHRGPDPRDDPEIEKVVKEVQWADHQCHRSKKSGPAIAAKSLEDSHTSVTFLSVACSGAGIWNLIDTPYRGIHPLLNWTLPPQIEAVTHSAGRFSPHGGRWIDALIIAIGLNDLHFSTIIRNCAGAEHSSANCVTTPTCTPGAEIGNHHPDCLGNGGISAQLDGLPAKYEALSEAIRTRLPSTREVYVNSYPSNVFHGGGCGKLRLSLVGLDETEATSMQKWGLRLSKVIDSEAHRNRGASYRWNRVGDLASAFSGHPYCTDFPGSLNAWLVPQTPDAWFTTYERSWTTQGDEFGTAHPNARGHLAYAEALKKAMVMDQPQDPYRKLTFTATAIKANPGFGPERLDLTILDYQNDNYGSKRVIPLKRNGTWVDIPAELGRSTLDVFSSPASARHATELRVSLGSAISIRHGLHDAYGRGVRTLTDPSGAITLQYKVEVETPTDNSTTLRR